MIELSACLESVTADDWVANECAYSRQLQEMESWSQIPLLNSITLHNVVDGSLVRFRGMIQDMNNPEFYFENFEVLNSSTKEVTIKSGKYRDTSNIGENEKVNLTSNLQSGQRQTMVVISMPGLNEWAQTLEHKLNKLPYLVNPPNTTRRVSLDSGAKLKRPLEEEDKESEMEIVESSAKSTKERKTSEKNDNLTGIISRDHLLNLPLPDPEGKSCIVKTYDDGESLKLNDMIEVIGFLSVDPSLSGEFASKDSSAILEAQDDAMDAETLTHNPPPSLVPRVHAVFVRKLAHCNPLCSALIDEDGVLKKAETARQHLKKALTELLLGDELAAEYLICHLISSVYLRKDAITLGQFTLNLSNIPIQKYPNYTQQLYNIIKQFVTKSYYLPMTLENMNCLTFLPKKDYDCNRLSSGVLQLSAGTHLVLDETRLEPGTLDATGVGNVAALGRLIQMQQVEYDFKYYKMQFDSDVAVLVLSEGKSLLPCEVHVPLKPEESSLAIFNEIVEAATYYLKDDIMNLIRTYLTDIKRVRYTISEDLQFVQDDFVSMRAEEGPEAPPAAAADLHRLLVLARLVSLSRGRRELTECSWRLARRMEEERRSRLDRRLAA